MAAIMKLVEELKSLREPVHFFEVGCLAEGGNWSFYSELREKPPKRLDCLKWIGGGAIQKCLQNQ